MQINQIKIFNYGKLQNREYAFEPGINLIYGENEAGKSTMQAFLKSMLFGMEKPKGRAASGDVYTKYEPWHAPSYYSGAIHFSVDGKPFYLERNFYVKEKKELLCNEKDGEELSVAYGDLSMLLGGISKEAYEATYEIPQTGAATGTQLASLLSEYLSDASLGGAGSLHVTKAMKELSAKKKELASRLRKEEQQRKQQQEHVRVEKQVLERELAEQKQMLERELVEQRQMLEREFVEQRQMLGREVEAQSQVVKESGVQKKLDKTNQGKFVHSGKKSEGVGRFLKSFSPRTLRIVGAALAILNSFAYQIWYQVAPLFWLLEILFIAIFFCGIFAHEPVNEEEHAPKAHETPENQSEQAVASEKKLLRRLEEAVREKEIRLSNLKEQLEQLEQLSPKEQELKEDVQGLELALTQIQKLSVGMCEDIKDQLDAEVSRYVSEMTGGRYDRIRVDENGKLLVYQEGRTIPLEQLSKGTLEQMYFALRLAVGNVFTSEEKMPLLLDETFAMYDEGRLAEALLLLEQQKTQVFLFTCQKREEEILQKMGIMYQKVVL